MNSAEKETRDKDAGVFTDIVVALSTVDETSRPRILSAAAVFFGIEKLPTTSFSPRPQ